MLKLGRWKSTSLYVLKTLIGHEHSMFDKKTIANEKINKIKLIDTKGSFIRYLKINSKWLEIGKLLSLQGSFWDFIKLDQLKYTIKII